MNNYCANKDIFIYIYNAINNAVLLYQYTKMPNTIYLFISNLSLYQMKRDNGDNGDKMRQIAV